MRGMGEKKDGKGKRKKERNVGEGRESWLMLS